MTDHPGKDWKLKLRYGRLKTPFQHFGVIAEGKVFRSNPDFGTVAGNEAFFGCSIWASDADEAIGMSDDLGSRLGFERTGQSQIYETEPREPPLETPRVYGLSFSQFPDE